MHEFFLAESVLNQVLQSAREENLIRVDEIVLEAGYLCQVIPDVMEFALHELAFGTIAEQARIVCIEIQPKAVCRKCLETFNPRINDFRCPHCNVADAKVIEGNDVMIKSISGEKNEVERNEH